ncbi:fimbrial protein [Pseudomonas cerasi]
MKRNIRCFFDLAVRVRGLVSLLTALMVGPALAGGENNVHLYGALVAESCVIPPGEEEITLDLGTVMDYYFHSNTRTPGQPFSIHLTKCDLSLVKTLKITFLGTENAALPGLLAIDGGSEAKGIAIGLETEQGKTVPINRASDEYLLQSGDNSIALKAYVKGEPEAIKNKSIGRGAFSATATFSLAYE